MPSATALPKAPVRKRAAPRPATANAAHAANTADTAQAAKPVPPPPADGKARRTTRTTFKAVAVAPTAAAPSSTVKLVKLKAKLVRDSFTMPQVDFDLIAALKQRALAFQRPAKKSELLRAGLHALMALNDVRLRGALDALLPLKPGRPKQDT